MAVEGEEGRFWEVHTGINRVFRISDGLGLEVGSLNVECEGMLFGEGEKVYLYLNTLFPC